MEPGKRMVGLDLVRTTAILTVVVCHYQMYFYRAALPWTAPLGVVGVEIFFVLSGYLIGGILLDVITRNRHALTLPVLLTFWMRRWLRTIPNYLLGLLAFVLIRHHHGYLDLVPYLTFTQNLFHPVTDFYGISWSLAVEEWFYLLFPVLVFTAGVTGWPLRYRFLAAVTVLFVGPLLARILWGSGMNWDNGMRKLVTMRLDALMWGVLVAALRRYAGEWFRRLQAPGFFLAGLASLLVLLAALHARFARDGSFTATWADAFWFSGFNLAVALTLPFLAALERLPWPLHAAVERISLWSYSIYLFHEPVMWEVSIHVHLPRAVVVAVALAATFALCAAVYHFFEKPVLHWRDRLFPGSGRGARSFPAGLTIRHA